MQHDDTSDYRFHGMVSEGYEINEVWMNGFGNTYRGGPFGCDITVFGLIDDGVIE